LLTGALVMENYRVTKHTLGKRDELGSYGNLAIEPQFIPHEVGSAEQVMKTIVIGLGNPILGDDGVGWHVAEAFGEMEAAAAGSIEVDCLAVGGLALMERMIDYNRAILIDAIQTGTRPIGTVTCFSLEELPEGMASHLASSHDVTLPVALQTGRSLGTSLPEKVTILAIEILPDYQFSQILSPAVAGAVTQALSLLTDLLNKKPNHDIS
jgi:hydrogenase maturation protease